MSNVMRLLIVVTIALLGACAKESGSGQAAAAALQKARREFALRQYELARSQIEISLKADPRASEAHFLAAQIAEKLDDLQTALREYVAADVTGAGRSEGRHAAADMLLRLRAYNLAEAWIVRCLAERPRDKTMKAYRALLEQRLGDSRKASIDAGEVLSDLPSDPIANVVFAEQSLRRNDSSQALAKIDAGLSKEPNNRLLLQLKADAFSVQQSFGKATEVYQTLVETEPMSVEYRVGLAELVGKTRSVDEGENILRAGVSAAPNSVNMRLQLVSFIARHRDSAAAAAELRTAIQNNPNTTVYDVALADLYGEQRELDAAAAVLRGAVERVGHGAARDGAQLALARLLLVRDDIAAARRIVDELSKARPGDDQVVAVRGQILLKERAPEAAIRDFLAVAAHQPTSSAIFTLLADAYLQNDQPSDAIAALKRVLSLNPSNADIMRRIVDVQVGLGDIAAASRSIEDFLSRNPDSVPARAAQVRVATQGKDWTSAETALIRIRDDAQSEHLGVQLAAEIREAQKRYIEAADLYKKLLLWKDSDTVDIVAAQAFVRTSISAGQATEALEVLTHVNSGVAASDLGAYELALAALHQNLGQGDAALALMESAITQSPTSPAPYLQRSALSAQKGDLAGALVVLDRGRAAGAPAGPLLLARAKLQDSNGQSANAIATYREFLQIDSNSAVAANELTNTLADQKPLDKNALRDARDLLQRNAMFKTSAMIDTIAWANYRLGELQKGKDLLTRIRADQSSNPQIRFHYGAILIALGDATKGEGLIRTTLADAYPGREEAERMIRSQ